MESGKYKVNTIKHEQVFDIGTETYFEAVNFETAETQRGKTIGDCVAWLDGHEGNTYLVRRDVVVRSRYDPEGV